MKRIKVTEAELERMYGRCIVCRAILCTKHAQGTTFTATSS